MPEKCPGCDAPFSFVLNDDRGRTIAQSTAGSLTREGKVVAWHASCVRCGWKAREGRYNVLQ